MNHHQMTNNPLIEISDNTPKKFGFILTRHVNSHKTNKYWMRSVSLLNKLYPDVPVVIIDDNSNPSFLTAKEDTNLNLKNLTIIQSEYPGRGELLPFIYLLKHRWFESAVMMHDGVFAHKRIDFMSGKTPDVLPLWHFPYNTDAGHDNFRNVLRISQHLANSNLIKHKLLTQKPQAIGMNMNVRSDPNAFHLCFGVQTFIKLSFLEDIERKYKITGLIPVVRCRDDRCALERIMGCIFHAERPHCLNKTPSLFGHILKHKNAYKYDYTQYMADMMRNRIPGYFVKVWSGR